MHTPTHLAAGLLLCSYAALVACDQNNQQAPADDKADSQVSENLEAREPIPAHKVPHNLFEATCLMGPPVAILGRGSDSQQRYVVFQGPISDPETGEILGNYIAGETEHPDATRFGNSYLWNEWKAFADDPKPNELKRFQLRNLAAGVPDEVPDLKAQLGPWSFSVPITDTPSVRLVYDRHFCVGKKHVVGAYFNTTDNRVFGAKGITSHEKLERLREKAVE